MAAGQVIHHLRLPGHMEHGVGLSEGDYLLHEFQQILTALGLAPVQPGGFIILAVGIIIPSLRISKLISCQKERRALA